MPPEGFLVVLLPMVYPYLKDMGWRNVMLFVKWFACIVFTKLFATKHLFVKTLIVVMLAALMRATKVLLQKLPDTLSSRNPWNNTYFACGRSPGNAIMQIRHTDVHSRKQHISINTPTSSICNHIQTKYTGLRGHKDNDFKKLMLKERTRFHDIPVLRTPRASFSMAGGDAWKGVDGPFNETFIY